MRESRFAIPLLLASVAATVVVGVRPELLTALDHRTFDVFARQVARPRPSPRIVVVDIDERSLADVGQWPWPRDVMARLVTRLVEDGVAVIAFDVLFPESDRLGSPTSGSAAVSTDAAFAAALASANGVGSLALTFGQVGGRLDRHCLLHPVDPVVRDEGGDSPLDALFAGSGVICDVPEVARAAKAQGVINASPDEDGTLRRLPIMMRVDGHTYPSLALAAVQLADPKALALERVSDGTLQLRRDARRLRLDGRGNAWLRLRGSRRTYRYVSAVDVLNERVPAGSLDQSIVFVGATALGVRDTVATALDPSLPGVELHATLADTLLGGPASARPEFAETYELASAVVASLFAAVALVALGGGRGALAVVAGGAGVWFWARALYGAGTVLSPLSALLGLATGAATTAAYRLVTARRRIGAAQARLVKSQRLTVQALTSLTEIRSAETGQHARRTQACARLLLTTLAARSPRWRHLSEQHIDLISSLAPLHDIGKVGVSDAVLNKPGMLTAAELDEMRAHPRLGHDSLLQAEKMAGVTDDLPLTLAKEIVFTHHERWDGTGYPRGLRGTEIPLAGRVIALVDVYDALVSDRAYRTALAHAEAVDIITRGRGAHFDPDVVDAFLACHEDMRRVSSAPE